jgi:RNA polymerase sigma-70 factor (ECF subfamily)
MSLKPETEQAANAEITSTVTVDNDIVELLQSDRFEQAFDRLVARYHQKVFRLAWSYLKHSSQAEDATQETFLRLWRAIRTYNGAASLSTWLYTIARNTCLNQIRQDRLWLSLDEPAVLHLAEANHRHLPDESSTLDMRRLVLQLEEPERQVLILYYLEDRSIEEVSLRLGMPEGTVKSHLHRARKSLGQLYKRPETASVAKLGKEP